jgi:peptidoglycan/xylan/chitin deacetylase (PgdA/CDA1 family)
VNCLRLLPVVLRVALHLFLCIPGLITGVSAVAKSAIIVTVDVESAPDLPLPDQLDAVCTDGSRCGLMEIVRLLNVSHSPGTFFLNVYEYKKYGTAPLRNIAMRLRDEQQDVALHTHPHWAYDANRPYMYDYSLEQQTSIVQDGVRLLREWTGLPVVAHRAGAYSADRNTLEALARNGIQIDSSLFFGEPASRLNGLGLPNNLPSVIDGITEIPVSVYQREERPTGLGMWVPPLISVRKIDVNSLINEQEARSALAAAVRAEVPYVIVFLHSFSLIYQPGANGAAPRADDKARRVFETLLRERAAAGLPTTTMSALVTAPDVVTPGRRDSFPQVSVTVPVWRYLWHARHARFGILFLAAAAAIFAALLAFGVARMRVGNRRLIQ